MAGNVKNILVTGGAGFIGSNLCELLVGAGQQVVCVDSFFSGQKENIKHLIDRDNFTVVKHDITKPLKKNFGSIDEIYHLACPASPMQYQFDPVQTTKTSVYGTINILELARRHNAKVLFTSTSEVYGDPLVHPQTEEYFGNVDPMGKRSCYDEGKRTAESLCKDYFDQYSLDVRIVRLFNIYGPRMMFNDGRVMSNFILQALWGENIVVHGSGEQSRSFMYITDLLSAFKKVIDLAPRSKKPWLFNIGNPDERSIASLAEDIKKATNSKSKITYIEYTSVPERLGDPAQRCPDISLIKKETGWQPKINFSDGLKKTIEDFQSRLDNKPKILIFCPSYFPIQGRAEQALEKITNMIPSYDFTMITAKLQPGLAKEEQVGRIKVYRLGWGSVWDKYLLPVLGPLKAHQLRRKNRFEISWAVMASYGAIAAIVFSFFTRIACLVSLYEDKIEPGRKMRRKIIFYLHKYIFTKANRLQVIAGLTQSELAQAEDKENASVVDLGKGWEYISKKTREELQQLQILTSRL